MNGSNLLRKFICEAISDSVRERANGFIDEAVQLSNDIAEGDKHSIKQLQHVAKEMESLTSFFKRNDELMNTAFNRLLEQVNKMVKMTSFWNRPLAIGKQAYFEKLNDQAANIEHEASITKHLMEKVKKHKVW